MFRVVRAGGGAMVCWYVTARATAITCVLLLLMLPMLLLILTLKLRAGTNVAAVFRVVSLETRAK